jgi:hypothetical protein
MAVEIGTEIDLDFIVNKQELIARQAEIAKVLSKEERRVATSLTKPFSFAVDFPLVARDLHCGQLITLWKRFGYPYSTTFGLLVRPLHDWKASPNGPCPIVLAKMEVDSPWKPYALTALHDGPKTIARAEFRELGNVSIRESGGLVIGQKGGATPIEHTLDDMIGHPLFLGHRMICYVPSLIRTRTLITLTEALNESSESSTPWLEKLGIHPTKPFEKDLLENIYGLLYGRR